MTPLIVLLVGGMGIIVGALGGGGSVLAVPIFVYIMGIDPKLAIAMSLLVVAVASVIGAAGHWREGNVSVRRALLFGSAAVAGAYAAARVSVYLPAQVQIALLGVVMVIAAVAMWREPAERQPSQRSRGRGRLITAGVGLGIGALTGLVGVGGGFLFVPALVLLTGMPMRRAVGTSLFVIVMSATAGFLGHVAHVTMPWTLVLQILMPVGAGVVAGVFLIRFVGQRTLQRWFAVLLVAVAGWMLYQTMMA